MCLFKSEDSKVHSEICKIYSSKNSKFIIKTPCRRNCIFEDTSDLLTCLDYESDKIAFLGFPNYKFGFLNTITLHIHSPLITIIITYIKFYHATSYVVLANKI